MEFGRAASPRHLLCKNICVVKKSGKTSRNREIVIKSYSKYGFNPGMRIVIDRLGSITCRSFALCLIVQVTTRTHFPTFVGTVKLRTDSI